MAYRWSFSRLGQVEQCGRKFERGYIMGERGAASDPMKKGSLVHETLEMVMREAVARQIIGPLNKDKIVAVYGKLWANHYPDGGSVEHFRDGEAIVADWAERTGTVDYTRVVGIEKEFLIPLPNGDNLYGFIDIIERDESGTIVIADYKTNRAMYSRDEVEDSLQLGVYALAAKHLYPGEPIALCYDMLRHGYRQYTSRTKEQLDGIERYILTLVARAKRWAEQGEYPATINSRCDWCDFRLKCPDYNHALEIGELEDLTPSGWDGLSEERERMAAVEKMAKGRKYEIDAKIRTYIKENDQDLVANGRVYRFSKTTRRTYNLEKVASVLADTLGESVDHWIRKVSDVSSDKLKRAMRGADMDKSDRLILENKINALARKSNSTTLRSSKAKVD